MQFLSLGILAHQKHARDPTAAITGQSKSHMFTSAATQHTQHDPLPDLANSAQLVMPGSDGDALAKGSIASRLDAWKRNIPIWLECMGLAYSCSIPRQMAPSLHCCNAAVRARHQQV